MEGKQGESFDTGEEQDEQKPVATGEEAETAEEQAE